MFATLQLPDGHLAYQDAGTGRPVVLLHGGGVNHHMWDAQREALSPALRVIVPDARGHGRSATPSTPFRHCDDLAALLTHLGCGPATLVGVSMGASTVIDTALEHPGLVHALVISGAGTGEPEFCDPWTLGVLAAMRQAAEAGDPDRWISAFLRFTAGPHRDLDRVDAHVVARCRQMLADTVEHHVTPGTLPVLPTPVARTWERLPEVTVPLLAVIGELDTDDHIAMAERAARGVANGRSVTISGTAHYPNMERPEEFTDALREFLAAT
jgi:pimeloyl-ACP methyl ester carboxylesterase